MSDNDKSLAASKNDEGAHAPSYIRKDSSELFSIAQGIVFGTTFTSNHISPHDTGLLPVIFLPLSMMDEEQAAELNKKKIVLLFAEMKHAVGGSINGYPIFSQFGMLDGEDWKKVSKYIESIESSMRSLKPKDGEENVELDAIHDEREEGGSPS